jgi:hypothetical protein
MPVSVGNVVDFLHLNLVAVQQHLQNLRQEHLHLNINNLKKRKIIFLNIPDGSAAGGLSLLSFEAIYLKFRKENKC